MDGLIVGSSVGNAVGDGVLLLVVAIVVCVGESVSVVSMVVSGCCVVVGCLYHPL